MLHARRALVVLTSIVVGVAGILPAITPTTATASVAPRRAVHARAAAVTSTPKTATALPTLGYWLVASNGGVFSGGTAAFEGSPTSLANPIVGMAPTPSGHGYWMVASDGGIFSFGDATFHGSTGAIHLNQPIVGIAPTPSGHGYWMVASDGGIFSFGDATFHGSTGAIHLNQPIVGMAATPSGHGYWLVARDGGIFAFGDAAFHGSTGAMHLNAPIVGMAASPSGAGYWMVASDGGIFAFGDAAFHGSTGAIHLNQPIVGMAATRSGAGYWFVARDGGVFSFGDAQFFGSTSGSGLTTVVGMAASNALATGAPAKLAFRTQPSDATGGLPFATQPVVVIEDSSGAVVTTDTSTVTLSLTSFTPSVPSATLTCDDRTVAAVNGVATFSGCEVDHTGSFTLGASDGSLGHAASEPTTITVGAAAALQFTTQPSGAVHGVPFGTQPAVSVVDAGGNTVTTDASSVTLALTTPGGANLTCTTNPKGAVAGVATFAGCSVDVGGTYTLTATDGSLTSAVSSSVDITGAAAKVAFTVQPSATASGGTAFATQPVVTVEDSNGHRIIADTSNVTLTLTSGGGTLTCTTNPKAAVAGVATFAGCNIDRPGNFTLTAADGSLTSAVSSSVAVSVGAATKLAFTTQPGNANGGSVLATQPVVTVEDAGGNAVTSSAAPVTLALTTPGGATLTCTANPVNAASGVATFAGCRVDHANTYTLTATSAGLTSAASASFTISVGSASKLAFTTQPAGASGGSAFTTQPVVTVQDAGGNTVTGDTSAVTLALTTPGGATFTCSANPKSAVAGVATFAACTIDVAGTYTLTATDGSLTAAVSVSFTNAVGAASQVEFTTQPVGSAGGTAFATQPVVKVEDPGGNTVTANTSSVTLTITTPAGATLVCTANPKPAVAGLATFAGCNIDKAGTYTLTASDGLLLPDVSDNITITPGTATQLAFTTQPGSGTGGVALPTQPVVAIEDSLGNTVTDNVTAVTLTITTPAGATLACTANPKTAVAGVATFAGCNIDKSGTYTLTAADGSLTTAVSTSVVISVGPAARVHFTTQPVGANGGDPFATQPVVTVRDAGGNTVTSDTSSVTLAITTPGGATLTCTTNPKAAVAGVATFAGCNIDKAGTYTLTASDGSLTADVSSSLTIAVGPAAKVAFTTQPSSSTGGTAFDTQPVVGVEDAVGNVVTTDTSSVTVTLTTPGGATLLCTTNPKPAVAGVATFANCAIDVAGTYTLTASDGSLTSAVSSSLTISVGDPAVLAFTTQPSSATGGLPFATQPAVSIEDAGGNVTADTSAVTLNITTPAGATLSCTANPKAAVAGVATFAACNIDKAGTYTLTASDGSLTPAVSSSLTISVGSAAKVAFTTQPSSSTGGTVFGTQPVVAVQDAGGNTVTTDTSSVTLTITTPGGAALSCTANPKAAVAGVATFAGCNIDKAGAYTLTASDGSLTSAASSSLTISVGSAAKVGFTTQPSSSTGGTAFGTQPVVAVQDAGGNTVTTDTSSVTLTLTVAGGATLSCTTNPKAAVAGVATFAGCSIDLAGTYTLTAADSSLTPAVSSSVTVSVGTEAKVAFTTQPSSSTGGSAFGTQPVVAVQDAGGNTVTSDTSSVTLTITTPAGAILSCTTNPKTAVAGVATFAGCNIDVAGTYTLTASDGSLTPAVSSSLTISVGSAAKVAFTTQPVGADGGDPFATQPAVSVEDAGGNVVTSGSSAVLLAITTPGGATLSCTTNPNPTVAGVSSFAGCSIDVAGTYTLTASDGVLTSAVSSSLTISVGDAAKVAFTTQPSSSTGGTAFGTQPVVSVEDAVGNVVTTDTSSVTLAITTPGGATLSCTTNPKAAVAGVATFAGCNIDKAGTYTLTASDGSLTSVASASLTISVGDAAKVAFTTQPSSSTGGTAFGTQPVVAVQDAGGNTVTGDATFVTLTITTPGGATLSCTENPKGAISSVATFVGCKIDFAGTYTLTASDGSYTPGVSSSLTISVGSAAQVAFTTQPSGSTGGIAFPTQPVVTVQDAGGNTVTGDTSSVTLTITTPAGATLSCTTNPEAAVAGVVTFAGCNIDQAGPSYTLTASDGSLTSAQSNAFAITVGPAVALKYERQPVGSLAGFNFPTQPIVRIVDAGGNVVSSDTSSVTLTLNGPPANLTCTANPQAAVAGEANFAGCQIDAAGTYTITASDGSLTPVESNLITIA